MNEQEAIWRTVEVLDEGLPDEVTVRTEGGGEFIEFPMVIVSWSTRRLDRLQGNTPFAGATYEGGKAVGRKLHAYFEMRLDLWLKTYDDEPIKQREEGSFGEGGRDEVVDMMHGVFVPFEYDASKFHPDSFEFQVEDAISRADPKQEPNWFETDQTVTFRYVKEVVDSDVDTLETVQENTDYVISWDSE